MTNLTAAEKPQNPRVPNETQPRPGLLGWYYEGKEFDDKKLLVERIDPTVNFAWAGEDPAPGVAGEYFCVRWVGFVKAKTAGHYTFATITDDGVKLSIDGKQIIDQWTDQGDTRVAGDIDLTAGDHAIQLDYYQGAGGSTCKLFWARKDGFAEVLIPTNDLHCDPKVMKHPTRKAEADLAEQHPDFPEGFNLADWTEEKSNDPKGQEHMAIGWRKSVRKEDRSTVSPRYTFKGPYSRYHILHRPATADGSNELPLITTLGLQQTDQGATAPFRLAYCWDARNFVAIGMSGRYNTAVWVVQDGRRSFDNGLTNYITDAYYRQTYFRLVLLTDTILVQASAQRYFNYRTIYVVHNRKTGMAGKPTTVMGIGTVPWDKDYGKANLCNDWPNNDYGEEFTEILYYDQRAGLGVHPGRAPEIGEATDWAESEAQLNLKAQPPLWNVAILGKDYRSFLAPQGIEQNPQINKALCDKAGLDFVALDLKDNSDPYNFSLGALFKGKDLRKTSALLETTIPRGEDPFFRVILGASQQASVDVGGKTVSSILAPGYYENFADRFAVVGRADATNSGVLRFKLWNDDRQLQLWARVLPNFPGSRIAQLDALIKAFPKEADRARRVHAHLEIGALALQFYEYALARDQFKAALAEAETSAANTPARPDLVEQALLSLMDLYDLIGDTAGLDELATLAQKLPLAEDIRFRGWCCAADSRLYRSGPTAAGAWLDQSADATRDADAKQDLYRLAARGYAQSGLWGAAAAELDKAAKASPNDHSLELGQTAIQFRIDEAIAGGALPDTAAQAQLPAMKKLVETQTALTAQQPAPHQPVQSPWAKYWIDRATELEPKQPGRAYAALQAALFEQTLWRLASDDLRADLFSGQPMDYAAAVDIAKDKFTYDRNKLWEVAAPEMSPPWELHDVEPFALDSMTHVFDGEKGGGTWKPIKDEWFHMLNIDNGAPVGVYHARTTIQIPAKPADGLKIWIGLNAPGRVWIDGKLVFEQTRATKSQYDMLALPAGDFKPGPHQVLVKIIHSNRNQRRRVSVRVSTMSAFRVYTQHAEAQAIYANYRDLNQFQDRLSELAGNLGEFLSYEGLALASCVRAELAGGSQDYAVDRAIGSVDAAMKAPDGIWAGRIIDDVAWRLRLSPRPDHRTDSLVALLERWRNLGLNEYNLASLERAQRFGLIEDPHGRAGAFGLSLRGEVQGLLGNLASAQEAIDELKTEYADCDNGMASAGLLLSRLGHRERAQRDFMTSDDATADIEDAQRMIEQEEYKRALARLLKTAAQQGDKLFRVEGGRSSTEGRLVSVRTYVHDMLGIMPPVIWPIYGETYDAKSLTVFADAQREGTLDRYLAVADSYPFTAGSLQALNMAGALALDKGEPDRAAVFFGRLQDETEARAKNGFPVPPGGLTPDVIRFKRAAALYRAGRGGELDLKSAPPAATETITFRGQSTPLSKLWSELAAQCAAPLSTAGDPGWRSLRGNLEQSGRVEADLPTAAPVLAWEGQAPWISDADAVAANIVPAPFYAGLQTAAVTGDTVTSAGDAGFIVRRLADGRRLWSQEWNDALLHLEDQGHVIDFTGVPMHAPDVANGIAAARVIDNGQGAFEARRLTDGRLIASTRTIDELKNFCAFGAPVLADGLLIGRFLSIRDSGALAIAAVDLNTGRLAWMQQLVNGTAAIGFNDVSIPLAIQLPPPAFRDGILYLDTGLGAIAAVEARTGSPRWVTHYDRAKVVALDDRALSRAERYMMTPYAGSPAICSDRVIVRPRDRAELIALDAASGKIRWQRRSDPGWYLIGATPQGVYCYDGMLKFIDATTGETGWSADLPMPDLTGRGFIARDGVVLPTTAGISLFSSADGHRIRTLPLPAELTHGHLIPVVQSGKLTRLLQADEQSLRCWSWTGNTPGANSLESQMVAGWDSRRVATGTDDDENHEDNATPATSGTNTTTAAPSAAALWNQLIAAAKTAPVTPGEFLYQDPNDGLVHIGSEWAVNPAVLVPLAEPATPYTIAEFAQPLPPTTPTSAMVPLLRFDGGHAAVQRDPNNANHVYIYAGGVLTAVDLAQVSPQILWRRVTSGNLTAFAANEGRVVCCSYNHIWIFDAETGTTLMTRNLGNADNWNERPEWITNVAVGHNQVAVFLTSEVGFRQWYDRNARSRIVEVYDIANGTWLWRRSMGGYQNHFEGPAILGDRLYAYETPEYDPQTSATWTMVLKTGEILARDPLPKGRDYAFFDDPANRGYFLHHNGELSWFDVAQGKTAWQVRTPLLDDEYSHPFGVADSQVLLMGRQGQGPYTTNVFDRKTGKTILSYQGDGAIVPEGGSEFYTFGGIANTTDLKITRHDLAEPTKAVFEQVWPGLNYLRLTPYNYVSGDSVIMIAYAKQYYVQPWYEYVVFSRTSGTILHHEKFSLEAKTDPWNHPSAQVMRFGRDFLLQGNDGVMLVGPLTANGTTADAPPVDITEMKDVIAREAEHDPLRANLFRSALTTEFPPISMALRTGERPPVLDGNLADWQGFDPWELSPPQNWHSFTRQPLTHPELHGATIRSAWSRDGLYLAVEVRDPSRQTAPPNADYRLGDSIRVTIMGDPHVTPDLARSAFIRDNTAWIDVVVTSTGTDTRIAHLAGDANGDVQYGVAARPDLGEGGRSLELFVPWTALDLNLTEWREDRLIKLLVNVAIPDADAGQPAQGMLEFGAGVSNGPVEPQRFGEIHLIDLSSERMAQMVEVIDIIPDDPKTWEIMSLIQSGMRGAVGLKRRIAMFEGFVTKHPESPVALRAIPHLSYLYAQAGIADPSAKAMAFAAHAKVPGDKLAPYMKSGFHFKLWLNPQNPPSQVMIQFNTNQYGWSRRGSWGNLFINWGQRDTDENMLLGPLPPPGKWVDMFIPSASQGLEGQTIVGVAFSYRGGDARFDAAEFIDANGQSLVYLDDSDEGFNFRNTPIAWDTTNKASGNRSFYGQTKEFISNLSVEPKNVNARQFKFPFASAGTAEPTADQLNAWYQAAHLLGDHPMGWEFFNRIIDYINTKKNKVGLLEAYTRYVMENPDSPYAANALKRVYEVGQNQFAVTTDYTKVEALMKEAKVTTDVRRAFYAQMYEGISALDILGPLDGGPTAGAEIQYDPEKNLDFKAHLQGRPLDPDPANPDAEIKHNDLTWSALDLRNHKDWKREPDNFNFRAIWPEKKGELYYNRAGFAHFVINSKSAMPAYLYLGAERVVTVYVNNKQIVKNINSRGQKDYTVIPMRLVAGDNQVLIKFGNNEQYLSLQVRVGDRNGKPIDTLKFSTTLPPPKPDPKAK